MDRLKVATVWLGGCAGCHMSFLDLDEFLLDSVENAELAVNPPRFDALVLIADKPWEKGGITSYGNAFWDSIAGEYRLYYVPVSWDAAPGFCLALATSKDGVNWDKPDLGAVEWQGSKDNNIVVWAQREGTVLIDPNASPERRYAYLSSEVGLRTRLFTSPDGIHFTMDEKVISEHHSDSQISSFWDGELQRYLHYPRQVHEGARAVGFIVTQAMDEAWQQDVPVVIIPSGPVHLPALLAEHLGIASRGEARRLIRQGGVTIDGERIVDLDVDAQALADKVVRAGKRRFARIEVAG